MGQLLALDVDNDLCAAPVCHYACMHVCVSIQHQRQREKEREREREREREKEKEREKKRNDLHKHLYIVVKFIACITLFV